MHAAKHYVIMWLGCKPYTLLLVLGILLGCPDIEAPINTCQSTRVCRDDFVRWYP